MLIKSVISLRSLILLCLVWQSFFVWGSLQAQTLSGSWSKNVLGVATGGADVTETNQIFTLSSPAGTNLQINDTGTFLSNPLTGDGALSAYLESFTGSMGQASVAWRESAASGAISALVTQQGSGGAVEFAVRTTPGQSFISQGSLPAGQWVWFELVRKGNLFTGYAATATGGWQAVGSYLFSSVSPAGLIGLVESSPSSTATSATWDSVNILPDETWGAEDIGTPSLSGATTYNNGVFTLAGAGVGLSQESDSFQYAYQSFVGSATLSAQVTLTAGTSQGQAGLLFRQSKADNAPFILLSVSSSSSSHTLVVTSRSASGGPCQVEYVPITLPGVSAWLRLVRNQSTSTNSSGETYTAYVSSDGATWTASPAIALSLATSSSSPILGGFVVSSQNESVLSSATFGQALSTSSSEVPTLGTVAFGSSGGSGGSGGSGSGGSSGTPVAFVPPVPVIESGTSATAQVGSAFSYPISATNSPTSYAATNLPAGLTLNSLTGLISGTPAAAVSSNITVGLSATNAGGTSAIKDLTLTVLPLPPVITSPTEVTGILNQNFTYQVTASNSPTSYNFVGNFPAAFTRTRLFLTAFTISSRAT